VDLIRKLTCTAAVAFTLPLPVLLSRTQPDHLLPVDLNEFQKYRAIAAEKMCPTPFDCGRMIVTPAFIKPEQSVSVYSRRTDDGKRSRYYVAYLEAKENIWDASDGGRLRGRAKNIKVRRVDAEIAETTAQLVKQVWIGMLSGPQSPRKWPLSPEFLYQDATHAEFSIRLANKKLYGETPLILSDLGKKTRKLVELADTLADYCKLEASNRPRIAVKIERQATHLLAQLNSEN
jgi:hypothetical protein